MVINEASLKYGNVNKTELKSQLTARKEKIESTKRHILNLRSKKLRLELEIKSQLKALKKNLNGQRKVLKETLGVESDPDLQAVLEEIVQEDHEMAELINASDRAVDEINVLNLDHTELTNEEAHFLSFLK